MIAELSEGDVVIHKEMQVPVKIGAGGINSGIIAEAAFLRGMDALKRFKEAIQGYTIDQIKVFGTSALRDASNGKLFIKEALNRYGFTIELIDGEREAALIYEGVSHSLTLPGSPVLIMDIGGGSVEFIIGNKKEVFWKRSFAVGAARLMDKFHHQDPIGLTEINQINAYLDDQLDPLWKALQGYLVKALIGSAGAFETLRDVLQKDLGVSPQAISTHACQIKRKEFDLFYELMVAKSKEGRAALNGLLDFRVDMIVVSAILMQYIISRIKPEEIIVSDYALKEGMLFSGEIS